jgi:DNA-binding NarL/FixJ family response regulator
MHPVSVVIAHSDNHTAAELASSLHGHFRSVSVTRSLEEARSAIPKHRAQLAVVDLELASLAEVRELCNDFNHTAFVCTHRIPDEEMWAAALAAGAIDCCQSDDVAGIVGAVKRNLKRARSSAA